METSCNPPRNQVRCRRWHCRLRAACLFANWLCKILAFYTHYCLVWEPLHPSARTKAELKAFEERVRSGPMRFEYAQLDRMEAEIGVLFLGHEPARHPRAVASYQESE